MIQRMLAIWSLGSLPFLKPAWTSGSPSGILRPFGWQSWPTHSQTLMCRRFTWGFCSKFRVHSRSFWFNRQYCSVAKSSPTLYDPMDCSTPGFPALHCLPEFAQTHVHWVSDAIQPSRPLLPPGYPRTCSVNKTPRISNADPPVRHPVITFGREWNLAL